MSRKISKGVSEIMAKKFISARPVFDEDNDDVAGQIMDALNWYNAIADPKKERTWFVEYAKKNKMFDGASITRLRSADANMFNYLGRYTRMLLDGFPLDGDNYIQKRLKDGKAKITAYLKPKKKKTSDKTENRPSKPSIQDRMDEKAMEVASDIQTMLDEYIFNIKNIKKGDDGDHVNIESYLNVEEVKPLIAKKVLPHIKEASLEWDEVIGTKDKDLKEAYSYLTLSEQKRIQKMYKKVLDEIGARAVQKTQRKARKKKIKTPEQITSKVKYQKETKDFGGHTSVNPKAIIGKNRVILFNTKYREFQIIEAENEKIGLTVEGTTIKGIDKSKSVSKRIREKYVEDLLNIATVKGIRAIRSQYKSINAKEGTPTGRINENTLIIKVMS